MKSNSDVSPINTEIDTQDAVATEIERWLAIRKEAGLNIDAANALVRWEYAYIVDPYGVYDDLSPEEMVTGRVYFARSPESDIWVCFYDIPKETTDALWQKHAAKLAFPSGLWAEGTTS